MPETTNIALPVIGEAICFLMLQRMGMDVKVS